MNRRVCALPLRTAASILLAAVGAAAWGQSAPTASEPPSTGPYFEVVDVQVVNVEVFVTDRDGHPVPGLRREDFEIREDGRSVDITNFFAIHDGQAAAAAAGDAGAASVEAAAPSPVPPEDQRLNLVIFLDHLSLLSSSRNFLLPTLERLLTAQLQPGDQASLLVYDGASRMLLEPTGDSQAISAALAEAAKMATRGSEAIADRSRVLRAIDLAPLPGEFGPFAQDSSAEEARAAHAGIVLYAQHRLSEARRTTAALSQAIAALAGARGRKVVLYLGEGFPQRPAEALVQAWESKFGRFASQFGILTGPLEGISYDASPLVERVARDANANLVTLYLIGPPGGSMSAEEGLTDASGPTRSGGRLWGPEIAAIEAFNQSSPLRLLADETGGRAAVDGPNSAILFDWLREDLRSYYSLGYTPPHTADGKPHSIEVRLRNPQLRLRHRSGYLAKTADQRMRDRTLSALMLGGGDNPLEVAIDFGRETVDAKGRYQVEITVKFPMANVFLVPQERHHEGRLAIFLGSRGEDGGVSDITKIEVPLRVPNDRLLTALGQTAAYRVTLLMRRGLHHVAAGVRDELGNVEAAVRVSHTAGAAAPAAGR